MRSPRVATGADRSFNAMSGRTPPRAAPFLPDAYAPARRRRLCRPSPQSRSLRRRQEKRGRRPGSAAEGRRPLPDLPALLRRLERRRRPRPAGEGRDEFDRILRFWFDRGVAGFRIDVVHMVVKDALLRDNPPATDDDHWMVRLTGQRQVYNGNRPEVHDVIRRWRQIADSYDPPRILVGETHVFDTEAMLSFYGTGDELNLAFNFLLLHSRFEADAVRKVVEDTLAAIPSESWPVWTGGNHDMYRFPSRWAEGDPAKTRCALMMLLTLPGSAFLYYGDEVGMPDPVVPKQRLEDPVGKRLYPVYGRDPERTPMPWSRRPGAGVTGPNVEPSL